MASRLRPLLGAAEVAGDDGEADLGRELGDVGLGALDHGADDLEATVVGGVLRGHGLELAGVEEVHQEGLQGVVAVVAQRDLVALQTLGGGVEDASAQPGAQGAVGLGLVQSLGDDRVGVLGEYLEGQAKVLKPGDHRAPVVARLLLIEVDRDQLDRKGETIADVFEQVQQGVLAAADGDHDPIAGSQQLVALGGLLDVSKERALERLLRGLGHDQKVDRMRRTVMR